MQIQAASIVSSLFTSLTSVGDQSSGGFGGFGPSSLVSLGDNAAPDLLSATFSSIVGAAAYPAAGQGGRG
jgi:hypothetical protein